MFIIYINDVIKYVDCAKTGLYADHTVCYRTGPNINSLNTIMQQAGDKFAIWCSLNRLTINLGKSKVLLFSTKKGKILKEIKSKIAIKIEGHQLETVTEYKYLGILLDQNLDYVPTP